MSAASNYLENKLLDHTLGVAPFAQPASLYVGLFTGAVGADLEQGIITGEISGNAYARQPATFGAAAAGTSANSATISFPEATGSWGSIDFVAVLDAQTAGEVLFYGAPNLVKSITAGDIYQISLGNLTISLA